MTIINLILGIPLLIWGRKLFWLFVGAVGFIAGFWLAQNYFTVKEQWLLYMMGIIMGLIGILFAVMVQKLAVSITGFLTGVYLMINLMNAFKFDLGPWNWFIYIAGGMVGMLLVYWMFDWALIILSSLVGASLISQATTEITKIGLAPRSVIFIVLLIIGLIIQYEQKQRES